MDADTGNRMNSPRNGHIARPTPAGQAHRVLGLPASVHDPVQIILAAHIQLRRWRLSEVSADPAVLQERVRKIIAAREVLLEEAFALVIPRVGVHSGHELSEHGARSGRRIGGGRGRGGLGSATGHG